MDWDIDDGMGSGGPWGGSWTEDSSSVLGTIGNATLDVSALDGGGSQTCNKEARLYAIGPLMTAPGHGPGDFDRDDDVDADDYQSWRSTVGSSVTPFSGADGNGDGIINAADYVVWLQHLSPQDNLSSAVGVVPEPSAGLLALLVLAVSTNSRLTWIRVTRSEYVHGRHPRGHAVLSPSRLHSSSRTMKPFL